MQRDIGNKLQESLLFGSSQEDKKLELTNVKKEEKIYVAQDSFQAEEKKPEIKDEKESKVSTSKVEKKLLAITSDGFKDGDIIFFLPSRKGMNCTQQLICCFQALTKRAHGHYEITHAAIFVGYEEKNGKRIPKIADITGKGYRIGTLKENQPVLVFRATNHIVGEMIAGEARGLKETSKFYWDFCTAMSVFFKRKNLDPNRPHDASGRKLSKATMCSRFVIQVIKSALAEMDPELQKLYYPNINSASTPKDLEGELHKNDNYQMLLFIGKNNLAQTPYELIRNEITTQMARIEKNGVKNSSAKHKFNLCNTEYTHALEVLEKTNHGYDDVAKAIYLVGRMEEVFAINTGYGFRNVSAAALSTSARNAYLFKSVIDKYKRTQEDKSEAVDDDRTLIVARMTL